jgi:hypothetical protein
VISTVGSLEYPPKTEIMLPARSVNNIRPNYSPCLDLVLRQLFTTTPALCENQRILFATSNGICTVEKPEPSGVKSLITCFFKLTKEKNRLTFTVSYPKRKSISQLPLLHKPLFSFFFAIPNSFWPTVAYPPSYTLRLRALKIFFSPL